MSNCLHDLINFRSVCILVSGCLTLFLTCGSFKASGVLFEDAVQLYSTSSLFGGWVFSLQTSAALIVGGIAGSICENASYRAMGLLGGFLFGLGFSCIGLFGREFWHFCILLGTTAVGVGLLDFACFMSFIVHFKTSYQSLNSIRKLFAYVGITLIPPLVELLRSNYGFNGSYLILGAICWNGVVCALLLKDDRTHRKRSCSHSSEMESYDLLNRNTCDVSHKDQDTQTEEEEKLSVFNLRLLSSVTSHPLYAGLILTEGLFYYNFVIWAIFLVPFGRSVGLNPSTAVFLSTAGGFGGLVGKLAAFLVCYFDKMNPISAFLVPAMLCNGGVFGYIFTKNSISLYLFSSICGFSFAFSDTALSGMVPLYVCSYHLRQGAAIGYIVTGTFMQLGGIIAGAILDWTSSFFSVFLMIIAMNVGISIIAFVMHVTNVPLKDCTK